MSGETIAPRLAYQPPRARWLRHLLLGTVLGAAICYATAYDPLLGIAAALGIMALVPLLLRPDWLFACFVLAIFWIEEFPGGLGETLARSIRSPFYSKSLGAPGLNAPELIMLLIIGIFLLRACTRRQSRILWLDGIGMALALLATAPIAALVANFVSGNPFKDVAISETTGVAFAVSPIALTYIAFFQAKIFAYVFLAYVLGLLALRAPGAVERLGTLLAIATAGMCVIGFFRLLRDPSIVPQVIPLFYHSPTSWLFALFIFYCITAWSFGLLSPKQTGGAIVLCLVAGAFILISFRRTMWGGIALAAVLLIFYLPPVPRRRVIVLLAFFGTLAVLVLLATPLQNVVVAPALARINQTSVGDTSTLYRLALFVWFADNFANIPFFGFGFAPLWNKIVALGYFRINLENIHSLYFWWWLRFGYYGLLVAMASLMIVVKAIRTVIACEPDRQMRAIAICALLAVVILLFSGIFNPVYGEARYMIFTGLMLAAISVLRRRQLGDVGHGG